MKELLISMAKDMGITPYNGEDPNSFTYRVIYSALGMWCLWTAKSSSFGKIGSTKQYQTLVLNELFQRYKDLYPSLSNKFVDSTNPQLKFSVHFRRVYEETGYLLTDENNRNRPSNFGRSIPIGTKSLYFGIPDSAYKVNGLGIFTDPTHYTSILREFLIRDSLSISNYVLGKYNYADFYERKFYSDKSSFQFFNPLSNKAISQSWSYNMVTDFSVARNEQKQYYRVIRERDGKILFADENHELSDSFTSYEYRRLYYALKAYYRNPSVAIIQNLDAEYIMLKLSGHLPNREYYFLLLLSWPVQNVFDKRIFVTKKEFVPEITSTLNNLGIQVRPWN
jgi:hypothetical protein